MNQILKDLTIHGFRGFRDIKLSDMDNINIIVGNNNSGKTSILEAIALFCNPLDPVRWFEISKRSFYYTKNLSENFIIYVNHLRLLNIYLSFLRIIIFLILQKCSCMVISHK